MPQSQDIRVPMPHPYVVSVYLALCLLMVSGCDPARLFTDANHADDPVGALIEDLEAAGVEAARAGKITQPFLTGQGHVLRARSEAIQVFVYPDAGAAEREAENISPDGSAFTAGGTATMITWVAAPHFFKQERVIVLYVGNEATLLAALTVVLGSQFAGR